MNVDLERLRWAAANVAPSLPMSSGFERVGRLGPVDAKERDRVALVADQDGLVGNGAPRSWKAGATTPGWARPPDVGRAQGPLVAAGRRAPATVFALVAVLHAGWNLRVKGEGDRFVALWGQFLTAGAVCAAGLLLPGLPARDAWSWIALSACIHLACVVCLARAYGAGGFSLAYPLARGGGAVVAAIGGITLLDDHLSRLGYLAILVITGGLGSSCDQAPPGTRSAGPWSWPC